MIKLNLIFKIVALEICKNAQIYNLFKVSKI